ncbi:HlyD family efflux transporter periplasmic adaptor subunit [Candidatus Peregrinibacteria bacterium]|nr:HlyD family efflux transporter periplasmic adaptor subunit [Candidatus Peregrinibacteria bacterium]
MKKFWIISGGALALILIVWGYFYFSGENGEYKVVEVKKQDITEIVSEVGKVVPVKEVDLTFQQTGIIAQIAVNEGQKVTRGETLAKLDTAKIKADLANAQASVQEAQARLDKLYAGASSYDIQLSETAVKNAEENLEKVKDTAESEIARAESNVESAEIALENAEETLEDKGKITEKDIQQAYENALSTLKDTITKIDTALKTVKNIREEYFDTGKFEDLQVQNKEKIADEGYDEALNIINDAGLDKPETIEEALEKTLSVLNDTSEALSFIRTEMDEKQGISPTQSEKSAVDMDRSNINTAISNITSASQTIDSMKLVEETDLSTAKSNVKQAKTALAEAESNLKAVKSQWENKIANAQGQLNMARNELNLKTAPPRQEDVSLYRAQVNQAIAYVDLIQQNLYDSELRAPMDGLVTNIYLEDGELATINTPVLSVITVGNYQIESYISELDIAQVTVDDPVDITFDAFGKFKVFTGKIVEIDPYETVIDGDIYYKVTIEMDEYEKEKILSGMTADIEIKTASKENVLVAPSRYIGEEGGINYLKIYKGVVDEEVQYERVEADVGLEGLDYTEIVSGVEEGQKIIPYY